VGAGLEIEFGIAYPAWAALTPVDAGTRDVVTDGLQPLYDPTLLLAEVVAACAAGPGPQRAGNPDRHGAG